MMMRVPCVIVLIALAAMGSVNAQDIEPQFIPGPPTTEGPEIRTVAAVTENSNSIPTTTDIETDLISTVTPATETDDKTTEVIGTTTDVIPKDTTTDIAPTEAEDASTEVTRTATEVVPTTTTVSPEKAPAPRPEHTPTAGGAVVNCQIKLVHETPYYNWILGVVIVPKTCSYCCAVACIQKCIEIEPFYCIG